MFAAILIFTQIACEPTPQVRVYETSKSESTFVSGPLSGSAPGRPSGTTPTTDNRVSTPGTTPTLATNATAGPRRILGAIIPADQGCYFLKATDSPQRLEPLMADLQAIVQNFAIDPQTGRPSNPLPEGWIINPRNDIAIAELISPEATGKIKFTVTALAMPPSQDWQGYLLSNVNRWRGQLKLQELSAETLLSSLVEVPRTGASIPSYIFDAVGTGTGAMNPTPPTGNPTTPPTNPANSAASPPLDAPNPPANRPKLDYKLPEGWSVGQGSQFRLATLNIDSKQGRGEVTVSMATDNPQANAMMWFQQLTREPDAKKLEPMVNSALDVAQKFAVGQKQATLYEIRSSEQATAPMLLVVSLPTDNPELHLFVKLIGDNQLASDQKSNLIEFVQSIEIQ
ncbi:MAG: hypothetical protein LW699_05825 [Pirellula sp.]|nr:hypothetical protein [Pirellula sp.]